MVSWAGDAAARRRGGLESVAKGAERDAFGCGRHFGSANGRMRGRMRCTDGETWSAAIRSGKRT